MANNIILFCLFSYSVIGKYNNFFNFIFYNLYYDTIYCIGRMGAYNYKILKSNYDLYLLYFQKPFVLAISYFRITIVLFVYDILRLKDIFFYNF